ncbi:peptide-methionine (S)-S-oxide reductase MsrA [Paludisphaera sp.]|uniref:peptide-methionine (S)-S-oxide reductase MsrA n=1 Tax=Paludisphaera sp. TaxID=2017432 RepID=UPI00301B914A
MSTLQLIMGFGLAFSLAFAADAARGQEAKEGEKAGEPKLEEATFGGGCFWCTEAFFERLPGVKSVVSGYSGGNVPNPTYQMIGTGLTGHAEVIQITYDPAVISFDTLLDYFWAAHDPTTVDAQGPDYGPQYRSIILYHSEEQREAAQKSKDALNARRAGKSPAVTEIVPFEAFYPAEGHHQDFARKNPGHPYVQTFVVPKVAKVKAKLKAEAAKKAKDDSAKEEAKSE